MKRIFGKLLLLGCLVSLGMTSCDGDYIVGEKGPYFCNYWLVNALDTTLTLHYYYYEDKTFAVEPGQSQTIEEVQFSVANTRNDAGTAQDPTEDYLRNCGFSEKFYDTNEPHKSNAYIRLGEKKYRITPLEGGGGPLSGSNYRVKKENDTTFNFYFTVDQAYIATLDEAVNNGMQ